AKINCLQCVERNSDLNAVDASGEKLFSVPREQRFFFNPGGTPASFRPDHYRCLRRSQLGINPVIVTLASLQGRIPPSRVASRPNEGVNLVGPLSVLTLVRNEHVRHGDPTMVLGGLT